MQALANQIVTMEDYRRIKQLIRKLRHAIRPGAYLNELERKLRRAIVLSPDEVPADVITMNTRARLELLEEGSTRDVLLVYPHLGMERNEYECVLGELGTALLGSRAGEEISHGQGEALRVQSILYQPEAQRDFYL